MSPISRWPVIVLVMACCLCSQTCAADLPGGVKLQTFVRPKKSSSTQDRASEYVQRAPDFSLNDGNVPLVPNGVGFICLLERAQGDQLLVSIRSQGLRGWAPAGALVPLNHAEALFSQQIQANPRDPFAFLMRGMVRFENDDLDHAFADVDEAHSPGSQVRSRPWSSVRTSGSAGTGSTWPWPTSTRRSCLTRVIPTPMWNGASFNLA